MTLKELRQQRALKATRGKAATTEYNTLSAKADRTEEEDAKLASLDSELEALEASVADIDAKILAEETTARRGALFSTGASPERPAALAAARAHTLDPERTAGFNNLAEFAVSVRNAQVGQTQDPRLNAALPASYNQNGGQAGEGYLVPMEFREAIWELVFQGDDLLNMVDPEPTNSNVVGITKDETTPWGSSGVQAYWRAEADQMKASKVATKGDLVPLHELYAFVVATDELLNDAPRLNARLMNQASRAIRWKASDSIMWGDGTGKPVGFMNHASMVSVAKEAGQPAKSIVAANVANMYSRLAPGNIAQARWLASPDALPQIMTMVIGSQPIWTPPSAGFAGAPGGYLLGRPVMLTDHADTLGDLGDLTLFDPSGYYAATKAGGGIDFASSIHLYFDYGAQAFRWTFRFGGQPMLSAPIVPPRSTASRSHFVGLAPRA